MEKLMDCLILRLKLQKEKSVKVDNYSDSRAYKSFMPANFPLAIIVSANCNVLKSIRK